MGFETITLERKEKVALLTLNRPPMNPMNRRMYEEILEACRSLSGDGETKVLVITAAGSKAFSAGLDVKEVEGMELGEIRDFLALAREAYMSVERMKIPVIAAINGMALGGGLELALCCDLRFCSKEATLGQPEINLGIIPGGGGTQRLPRLIGPSRAKALLFSGEIIDAEKALELGIVDRVFEGPKLMDETLGFASKLAEKPRVALQMMKAAVDNGLRMDLPTALQYESECFIITFLSEDGREGLRSFVERRKPQFKDK